MILYDDFKKIELKTAKIISAGKVEDSEKLVRLEIDCGDKDESGAPSNRQIVAGIGLKYQPENLAGKTIIVVANLEPRKLVGLESRGMLLAASDEMGSPVLLTVMEDVAPGSEIR